jgi:predicted transcriptional regulator
MTAVLAPDLLMRLERLAQARHTDRDALLSEAIRAYLDREESRSRRLNPSWDLEAIRAHAAAFADEDAALADSDSEHRVALLSAEDDTL